MAVTVSSGTRFGPYEIVSPIGSGGMGEVYRARDTRLDRTVAVKILPAHLSDKPEARERFEREARAISALNHANVCQLYDVGHQDGTDYIVMEYLEGETLAARLERGALPLEQLLRVGAEIAQGLERAHRSGVIHRDLKPANIMLTKSGAKLMDFGLAKSTGVVSPISSALSATMTSADLLGTEAKTGPLTAQGMVIGTFQYMSPEQVEGREADARSDIFALGAVLYEMITGNRAFEGKTAASVLAAVLEREPSPISSLQPLTPPALERLVKSCLAKDPDERWQTAHDVSLQLRQIAESGSQAGTPVVIRSKRTQWVAWALVGFLAGISLIALGMTYIANHREVQTLRLQLIPPAKTQFNLTGDNAGPAVISHNGRYVVFSANDAGRSQLYLRALDSIEAQPLPGTDGATFPFFSPDDRSVAFFTADKLKRVEINGGTPATICEVSLGRGGSWAPDGTIVFSPAYNSGIFRVSAGGGAPVAVTKVEANLYTSHRWPWFLPDGKHFIYVAVNHNQTNSPESGVFFASLDGAPPKLLFHTLSNTVYASGYLLWLRENALVAQPFDPATGELKGDAQPLNESVQYDSGLWRANLSVSDTGMMVYASGSAAGTQTMTWFDRNGKQLGTVGERGAYFELELSPDEKKLAVTDANTASADIWVYDLEHGLKNRLTFSGGVHRDPVWSPDGRQIAYTANQQTTIVVKPATGAEEEKEIMGPDANSYAEISSWSPDGRYLMMGRGPGISLDQWAMPLFGDRKPFPYVNTHADERDGQFSPDRRWVAYASDETGKPAIFVAPFPWTGAKWQVSSGGGIEPRWRHDGKEIFFYDFTGLSVAEVDGSGSTFQVGGAKRLFSISLLNGANREYAVTRDGQKFLIITSGEGSSQPLTLVQNWMAGLKR